MELVPIVSYPVIKQDPSAFRREEAASPVRRRLEDQRGVTAHRQQATVLESDSRRSTITRILVQAPANQSPERKGLPQLPPGQSSSIFLAQQLAQEPENAAPAIESSLHRDASIAYRDTLGLTATILGLDGFRERII